MLITDRKYTDALRAVCEQLDYAFTIKAFRGLHGWYDPWFDYASMARCFQYMENPNKAAFRLLHLGGSGGGFRADRGARSGQCGSPDRKRVVVQDGRGDSHQQLCSDPVSGVAAGGGNESLVPQLHQPQH